MFANCHCFRSALNIALRMIKLFTVSYTLLSYCYYRAIVIIETTLPLTMKYYHSTIGKTEHTPK